MSSRKTYLEYRGGGSSKFWEIAVDGRSHTVRFGKIGTAGQTKTKTFKTPELAQEDADALTASKTKKGYVGSVSASAAAPAKGGKRGMPAIVEELIAATLAAHEAAGYGRARPKLRKPATKDQIAALEKAWKRPLPPSYRAFLEVTNGLDGDVFTHRLLGTEDQKWASRQVNEIAEFWDEDEFDPTKMFYVDVPDAGNGIRNLAAFDATKKGAELPVVDWDNGSELERFPSFAAYLEREITTQRAVAKSAAKEKKTRAAEVAEVAGGRATLASGEAFPQKGPARKAAFKAMFELKKIPEIERAIAGFLASKPSADELTKYFQDVDGELEAKKPAGFARAELAFVPGLKVPKAARAWWLQLGNNALARFANKVPATAARWADVLRPGVLENNYLGHNLAAAYASVGRIDDALAMVEAAIASGYPRTAEMRTDKDLESLFEDPRFQKLFGPGDKTDERGRTTVPRNPSLEAEVAAGRSIAKYGAWLTKEGSALGDVVAADLAGEKAPQKKKAAKARFESYKKDVLAAAFPKTASHFTHAFDGEHYFSFRYGFLEKLDTWRLTSAKERQEVLALLADPHAQFVKHVTLRGAKLDDLTLFSRLPALRRIQNRWTDITQVDSVEPLAKLQHLRALDLRNSKVKDLAPIAKLPLLQLYLQNTPVVDLSPLAKHPTLSHLRLDGTKVRDLSPLLTCPKLACVQLQGVKTLDEAQVEALRGYIAKARNGYVADDAIMDGYSREVVYFGPK